MDRREEVFDKALDLFVAEGFGNTPVSRIAKELKLTKAGLYHYFTNKEELLFTIHKRQLEKIFIPILEEAKNISDPEERISFFIRNYTIKAMTQDPSSRVIIHETKNLNSDHRKWISKIWRDAFELIRDALGELEAMGKIEKMNKTFASFSALGMCSWTFYWFDYDRQESGEELADTYLQIFLRGLPWRDRE